MEKLNILSKKLKMLFSDDRLLIKITLYLGLLSLK